jgi:hypothetical protein
MYGRDDTTLELHTKLLAAGVPVAAHFIAPGKHASQPGRSLAPDLVA